MTLFEIINTLQKIALTQPNIRTATDGDVFDAMNANPSVKYGVFHVSQTSHNEDEQFDNYGLNLFVIDRLEDDNSNRLQIQSTAKQILSNIINTFCETFNAEHETINYQMFTQRFKDNTAGAWATVTFEVLKDYSCAEAFGDGVWRPEIVIVNNQDITITQNGIYEPSEGYTGFGKVDVYVPVPVIKESDTIHLTAGDAGTYRPEEPYDGVAEVIYEVEPNQDKRLEVTENGDYTVVADAGYSGLGTVEVNVNVPDLNGSYDEGYDDGYQRGTDEAIDALPTLDITENGVYNQPSKGVNVNVPKKISVVDAGVAFGYSKFTTLPDYFYFPDVIRINKNTTKGNILSSMFSQCYSLTDLSFMENVREYTEISTSTQVNLDSMFYYCSQLEDITPLRNIRINVINPNGREIILNLRKMFKETKVKDFTPIEHMLDDIDNYVRIYLDETFGSKALTRFDLNWPWAQVTNYRDMLTYSAKIEYICELDATAANSSKEYQCLNVLSPYSSYPYLTYFGGFRNQKMSIDNDYFLAKFPNLTRESCLAIVNNLYDFTGNGQVPIAGQGVLKVHINFITALGDDISIPTSKGWTLKT